MYLLLERTLTRMLLGLLLIGNAVNLLILTVGGVGGNPPIRGRTSNGSTTTADPLAQGMILTAIVISMGIAAFVLALAYRSYRLTTIEEVSNDPEDTARLAAGRRRGPRVQLRRGHPPSRRPPRHRRPRRTRRAARIRGFEMTAQALIPLPVLIPALAAAATLVAGRRPRLQRVITQIALAAVVAVCAALVYLADRDGTLVLHVGGWGQSVPGMGPLGISLVVDRLSALMLLVSSIVLLAVVAYAIGQGIRDGDERQPVSIFMPTYLVLSAGVCTAFLAGDLFNLFVGFEVLLSASFVLLTIGASEERVRAGISYVMVVDGVVADLPDRHRAGLRGHRDAEPGRVGRTPRRCARRYPQRAVLGAAGGVRHQGRGVPAVGVAARLVSDGARAGHRGVRRLADEKSVCTRSSGPMRCCSRRRAWIRCYWWPGLLTMVIGILGAIAQSDIKRLLSFTLVSHIGYMVFGVALGNQLGMSGAIYYVAHHIVVQTTLFLVVGLIERQAGASTLNRLGGLGRCQPGTGVRVRRARPQSWWYPAVFGLHRARWHSWRPVPRTVRPWPGRWSPAVSSPAC